ncbi:hypothetical protein TeGR_g14960 [Tetraparma gracilis]|uniref:Uncharacterized protein n=1 Tax=Tetraparma gracilis TaxID=2962635 RepID=A0ABQ6N1D3_9STRA|nr:hypothetical protein TeGR_g14960 [Tetraparma gracilis]
MRPSLSLLLLLFPASLSFSPSPALLAPAASATSLSNDFLGGKVKRSRIREEEDGAMWIDGEEQKKFGGKKGKAGKPAEKKEKKPFRFPWQKEEE